MELRLAGAGFPMKLVNLPRPDFCRRCDLAEHRAVRLVGRLRSPTSGHCARRKEFVDDRAKVVDALGAIHPNSQLRTAVQAPRVPGTERPNLVDDPPLVAACRPRGCGCVIAFG